MPGKFLTSISRNVISGEEWPPKKSICTNKKAPKRFCTGDWESAGTEGAEHGTQNVEE